MNRVEIKEEAKKLAFNNKWYLWKPMIIFGLLLGLCSGLLGGIFGAIGGTTAKILTSIISILSGLVGTAFGVGYTHYVLEFVRGNRFDWKETIEFAKKHWVVAILVSLLVAFIVLIGSVLLVVPGIIASIGLTFYEEVTVDNPELSPMDIVKKAWEMTKGHKMDLFIFMLSFFGWFILVGITFGIAAIWITPYAIVALTLVYEKLKKTA